MTLSDVEFNVRGQLSGGEDILRCLRNLILTPAGTVPLDRDFGLDTSFIGQTPDAARSMIAVELAEKTRRYEPRARIVSVDFDADTNGKITVKVVITGA